MTEQEVIRLDPQQKSLWLADGTRLGFAAARRRGIDVEALLARVGPGPHLKVVK